MDIAVGLLLIGFGAMATAFGVVGVVFGMTEYLGRDAAAGGVGGSQS